ncbi:MAG: DUF962 domain-containing protein [Pseudomonadota bacterium]|nr:hypothetical protein [Pseudomonadales bacterium]MAR92993.1 hypothetical protein [Pseudomonadales bacterium]MDY6918750.1 DUF962 domain-containing protein [Pseudomonadota bacterium]
MASKAFESFAQFYPFYLAEHRDLNCRRMHFLGSSLVLITLVYVLATGSWLGLLLLPVLGYGCAWLGHFLFEKNKPATFKHPWYSFLGDWLMYVDILRGRVRI